MSNTEFCLGTLSERDMPRGMLNPLGYFCAPNGLGATYGDVDPEKALACLLMLVPQGVMFEMHPQEVYQIQKSTLDTFLEFWQRRLWWIPQGRATSDPVSVGGLSGTGKHEGFAFDFEVTLESLGDGPEASRCWAMTLTWYLVQGEEMGVSDSVAVFIHPGEKLSKERATELRERFMDAWKQALWEVFTEQ